VDEIFAQISDKSDLEEEHIRFARYYFDLVIRKEEFLDREISTVAENWDIDRIALIDKLIIRMALCEMYFMPDIPEKVAINEAIDMSKVYSTLESSAFVNGILDAALAKSRRSSDSK
jgi:N utilization substance protein B